MINALSEAKSTETLGGGRGFEPPVAESTEILGGGRGWGAEPEPRSLPPAAFVAEVAGHVLLARALGVAVELGIADLVAESPCTVAELAAATGAHEASLFRLLRMLGGHGVFAQTPDGRIENTPRSEVLRRDHPDSLYDRLSPTWQNIHWETFRALPDAVRTGGVAFEQAFGRPFFDYLAAHPDANAGFDRLMASRSRAENLPIARAYPFGEFRRIIDIGGGRGGLLAAVLERHPGVAAALYDQPQVLAEPTDLAEAGLEGRVELVEGEFFDSIPEGYDLYFMKRIIHDWDDERAIRILANCRAAMGPDARVAVADALMAPGNDPDPNKMLDLSIMALTPGKERTEAEFAALFAAAGLRLNRIVAAEPPAALSIIEAVVADGA